MTPPTSTKTRPTAGAKGAGSGGRGGGRRIDPRIASRRTAVTREQGRRRLHIVMIGLVGTALLVGAWLLLLHTSLFSARAITVTGAVHETTAAVEQAAGVATHPPLFDFNAGAAAKAVEQLPWVSSASVSVHWPDGVRIVVHEETPRLAMALPANKWAEISSDGRVLAISATPPAGLLTLAGPDVPTVAGGTLGAKDAAGLAVATTLPPSFVAQVTAVTVEPGGWVRLTMTTPIFVNVGTATQLPAKYEDVSAMLSGTPLHNGDVIDVSVPDAPTVTGP